MDKEYIKKCFIEDFKKVKEMGFIESHRKSDTGIGKTFEDLIKIKENNFKTADYMSLIEIKSQREYTGSYITLFTKSPTFPKGANAILKNSYGYPDEMHPNINVLHTSIFYQDFNKCKNKFGFKLDFNEKNIILKIKLLSTNQIVSENISWNYEKIKSIINKKNSFIAVIFADTKKENNKEYFHFTKCNLLTGFNFEKFITAIKNNDIMFDIRIGAYKSGKNIGKLHDHGSGFRIHKTNLNKYFDIKEIL